jgi:hypothetical protein
MPSLSVIEPRCCQDARSRRYGVANGRCNAIMKAAQIGLIWG